MEAEPTPSADRPNILLIVADDMAYSDLGSFGGEIATPNLDRLAFEGIRFANFHTSTMCSPSRAMMLTGVDSHLGGLGNMLEELSPNQQGQPGYEGYLNDRVVTLPTILRDAGYQTFMTGKWHLGSGEGKGPAWRGFDRSFSLGSGGASHFADMRPAYAPTPDAKANYWEDGRQLESLPGNFHYSSEFYVDRMLRYLSEDRDAGRPFFAYLAFTAPHWPLQAPDDAIERQRGLYDEGYDAIADRRLSNLKALGIVPDDAGRSSRSPKERQWTELDDQSRKIEARAMEVYAAMVSEMDRHVGRLFDFLQSSGELDNTLVLFLSDNGPEGHDLDETWPKESFPDIRRTIDETHDFTYESMGRPGSYVLYGPNWANAGSPAFRLHKAFPTEGGTRVTAFAWGPRFIEDSGISNEFVFVADVTPTILAIAGVSHPGRQYSGKNVHPMSGVSFAPLLDGSRSPHNDRVVVQELLGKRVVRSGPWKLIHMPEPYGSGDWQLFNLESDLAESQDLSDEHPEVVGQLLKEWDEYAKANNVIIPDWVSGY